MSSLFWVLNKMEFYSTQLSRQYTYLTQASNLLEKIETLAIQLI
jgi:hypothetical protein